MKKNKLIYLLIICCIGVIAYYFCHKSNSSNTIDFGSTNSYAFYVDGIKATSVPGDKYYSVDTRCINADGSWDYDEWMLKLKNIVGRVSCDIYFTTDNVSNFRDYISSLAISNDTWGIIDKYGHRYSSMNSGIDDVENYVLFNGELWRIVGVIGSDIHGVSGKNLIKIVRSEILGVYTDYATVLNNNYYYYDSSNHTYGLDVDSSDCYNCQLRALAIKGKYYDMVQQASWQENLCSVNKPLLDVYNNCENLSGENATVVNRYVNQYSYLDYFLGGVYNTSASYPDSLNPSLRSTWLDGTKIARMLPGVKLSDTYTASFSAFASTNSDWVRPTLYLKDDVVLVDGSGTYDDPYIIDR